MLTNPISTPTSEVQTQFGSIGNSFFYTFTKRVFYLHFVGVVGGSGCAGDLSDDVGRVLEVYTSSALPKVASSKVVCGVLNAAGRLGEGRRKEKEVE